MTGPTDRVRRTVLQNGLRVVTDEQPERATLSVAVWVAVGSRDEPESLAGSSHFLEHLLFKGTAHRDARSIALAIDGVGGDMNAFTAAEHTAFYASVPAADGHIAVDLLLDVLRAPELAEREVEAERQVILDELAAAEEDPDDITSVKLFEALFPGHPLGRETLGSHASIAALERDDIAAFFETWYRPANLVVVAAGDLSHDVLVEEVSSRFGDLESGAEPDRSPPGGEVIANTFQHRESQLAHIALGWRAPSVRSDERYPLALMSHLFGGGPSSILFQEVREARGLTYSIGSEVTQHIDSGVLSVHCATPADAMPQTVTLIEGLAAELAEIGLDREELARAKGAMRGSMLMGLESPVARSTRIGVGETMRGEVLPVREHLERIEAVTVDDVRKVCADVFSVPGVSSVVGPSEPRR
ncbi:MAG: M16 family metallopeptidase [Microthrixaceae bacterium]